MPCMFSRPTRTQARHGAHAGVGSSTQRGQLCFSTSSMPAVGNLGCSEAGDVHQTVCVFVGMPSCGGRMHFLFWFSVEIGFTFGVILVSTENCTLLFA